ncbi:hypothetical protein H0H92_004389, partial [Tricholoma furcatifolium]
NGVETSSITLGYVLRTVDPAKIESAVKRLIDKWRLLAGRLEWSKDISSWCIRVPLKGDVSDRVKFTTSKLAVPLDSDLTVLTESSVEVLVRPSLKFFRHSSTPSSLSAYSSSNAPIVSIHVTELANCACVGLSAPHGVFDAFGFGQIIAGLNAELNGASWDVPVFSETNIMRETLMELAASPPLLAEEPAPIADIRREFVGATIRNVLSLAIGMVYEFFWKKAEIKAVYIGEAVVNEIVQKVKDEVKDSGNSWVSTGDVLLAWFLKTSTVDKRMTSTDNSIMPCSLPPFSKSDLLTKSLAELAILNRQAIDAVRNIPFIQAYIRWVGTVGGNAIPTRRSGANSVIFSNQVVGHLDDIDFGSEMLAFWHWNAPIIPDHSILFNKFKGGYIIEAGIRRSRWNAVAEAAQNLKV